MLPRFSLPGAALASILVLQSGCATLIGNVRPEDQKAQNYGILDLHQANPQWVKLNPAEVGDSRHPDETPTEIPDVVYQSTATHATISINSSCRTPTAPPQEDLQTITNLLFLGMSDVTLRKEEPLTLRGRPALQTTVQGRLSGDEVKIRTVVLRRGHCVYDLLYMASPALFADNEADFAHFVASLRLKE